MNETFQIAQASNAKGVVLIFHAETGLESAPKVAPAYQAFVDRLEEMVEAFPGQVLVIHGDSHIQRLDHPLRDRATGKPLLNFTRLETFGSPDVGWIRVVVDTVAGRFIEFEPRLMRRWWLW